MTAGRILVIWTGAGQQTTSTIQQVALPAAPTGRLKHTGIEYVCNGTLQRRKTQAQLLDAPGNMSAVWHDEEYRVNGTNTPLTATISAAMKFWFDRDYTNDNCLDRGGRSECGCDTPGIWNTNWFSNVNNSRVNVTRRLMCSKVILIPRLVVESCLLMHRVLEPGHMSACQHFARRSYERFYATPRPGYISGANILDIAKV